MTCRDGLTFCVSAVEIYFDEVLDVFNNRLRLPVAGVNELLIKNKIKQVGPRLIEDTNGVIFGAKEVTEKEISKIEDIVKFMQLIKDMRTPKKGKDPIFDRSSRSHLAVTITRTDRKNKGNIQFSKFTFIDLGGNDKIAKSAHIKESDRSKETRFINSSLSAL
jgi:hypothetical protein